MKKIDRMATGSGRRYKEDDTTINIADLIEDIHDAVNDADPAEGSLLGRIKSLEDKIDAITSGDTPAAVQLTGSILEIYGVDISERPDANKVPKGAYFMIVNTDELWQSNGTDWVVK